METAIVEKYYKALQSVSFSRNESLEARRKKLVNALVNSGVEKSKIIDAGEKPATGRCLGIKNMSDRVRINYRCGYGRYNYAPCVEVIF